MQRLHNLNRFLRRIRSTIWFSKCQLYEQGIEFAYKNLQKWYFDEPEKKTREKFREKYVLYIFKIHSGGPENLKKSRPKNL